VGTEVGPAVGTAESAATNAAAATAVEVAGGGADAAMGVAALPPLQALPELRVRVRVGVRP